MKKNDNRFRLLLVRHAQSLNNVFYNNLRKEDFSSEKEWWTTLLTKRESDPRLSPVGEKQAKVLGDYLSKSLNADEYEIISSPMMRALLTCLPLAKRVGKQIIVHSAFYEHHGCYKLNVAMPGSTKRELEEKFPVRCLPGMEKGWYYGHDEKETTAELHSRVESLYNWIYNELPKLIFPVRTAIIMGHGTLFNVLIRHLLGCRLKGPHPLILHTNIGISEINFVHVKGYGCGALVKALNQTGHIPDNICTGDKISDRWEEVLGEFLREDKKNA